MQLNKLFRTPKNQVSTPRPECGVEFDSSARAMNRSASKGSLMVHESVHFTSAVKGMFSFTTFSERKQMLKTLKRKIALVAVAGLGAGLISVAPASAAEVANGIVTAYVLTADTVTPAVGNNAVIAAKVVHTAAATTNTIRTTAIVTSKPAGANTTFVSTVTHVTTTAAANVTGSGTSAAAATAATGRLITTYTVKTSGTVPTDGGSVELTSTDVSTGGTATGLTQGTFTFTGSVAGAYTVRVFHDQNEDGVADSGEMYQEIVITVAAANTASTDFGLSNNIVASANADTTLGILVSAVSASVTQSSGRVGVPVGFVPTMTLKRNAGADAANDAGSLAAKFANVRYSVTNPAGSAVTVVTAIGGTTASTNQYIAGPGAFVATSLTVATTLAPAPGTAVYFVPATAGTYTITAWHDQDRDTLQDAYEAVAATSVVVVADALPSIVFTKYGSSTTGQAADGSFGQLVKISLANGVTPFSLSAVESLVLTGPSGTVFDMISVMSSGGTFAMTNTGASNGVSQTLTSANFNALGNAYVNVGVVTGAGGGTSTVTAAVIGGTASGASAAFTLTTVDTTTYAQVVTDQIWLNVNDEAGVAGDASTAATSGAGVAQAWVVKTGVATTVSASAVRAAGVLAAGSYSALVTDNRGLITGMVGAKYNTNTLSAARVAADVAGTAVISVSIPATTSAATAALGTIATIVIDKTNDTTLTITNAAAVATSVYVNPTQTAATDSYRSGTATANKITATVLDQFGNAMVSAAVAGAIVGRNAATVIPALLTDANGQVTYTLTDVYTGTLLLTDAITLTSGNGSGTVTINYATYLPTATITMTTPDSAAATASGIAGAITSDINAGNGAQATTAAVSVVLKDASGTVQPAGIPVVFTITGNTGAAITSTKVTAFTTSLGVASTTVYSTLNGNATVTATSGALTASGVVYFKQADAVGGVQAEARTITATATGNVVTAIVTDRFGNPIKGINVVASRVGTGTFNGTSSITGVTDKTGSVAFVLTNGTADITVGFSSSTFGQSYASKGYLDAGITALTAFTAGTTVLAAVGVGASFDAAGVNSVKVLAVTDAALAGTSTAITAVKADVATANSAVKALATQVTVLQASVATLIDSLTTQIASLMDSVTSLTKAVNKLKKKK